LSGYSNNATQSNQIQGGSVASGLFTKGMRLHQDNFNLVLDTYFNKLVGFLGTPFLTNNQ
jgi:hypothetical protein